MLDAETKRKIDSARQILVGVVPDPKGQVDQITTALIYKFMDDMDGQSQKMKGGKAAFFVGEFKKYNWQSLLSNALSGQARMKLYEEAIKKMPQNRHTPALFRSIFKNAHLPFNNPQTLTAFLKQIDEFSYDNSENLGNAFEHLLSILGAQGDAGQFRTPRHIIDFIVAAVSPQKHETILDPACGTAGFLISAYKHIVANSRLKQPETRRLMGNLVGYDISPDMVKLSLVNMYLHSFPTPKIYEYDTLTSEQRWDEEFDVVLANPPFMNPKGGIVPHNKFSIQAKRSEVLFVDYIAEHLNIGGRAGVIVPEGIIFQAASAHKKLRKNLVENWGLFAVVSLPNGVFNPYSGVKTSILLLDKARAKQAKEILFLQVDNDGFDLGAQRREIDKNDLPEVLDVLQAWQQGKKKKNGRALWARKDKIAEDGEYNLTGKRYKEAVDYRGAKWPIVQLGEITKFCGKGKRPASFAEKDGRFPFIVSSLNKKKCAAADYDFEALMIGDGGSANVHYCNMPFSASDHVYILQGTSEEVALKYIYLVLLNKLELIESGFKGGGLKNVTQSHLKQIKFPLPPLDVQKQIAAEIEQWQKVIDGAKQVTENWKPAFQIDSKWPMVKLGEILSRQVKNINPNNKSGQVNYVGLENIEANTGALVGQVNTLYKKIKSAKTPFTKGHILYGKLRPNLNKVFYSDFAGVCSTDILVLQGKNDGVNNKFYSYYLREKNFNNQVLQGLGGSQLPRVSWDYISRIKAPLPPLAEQERIVAEIEAEQKAVNANKELIAKMQQKIADKIAEVWR